MGYQAVFKRYEIKYIVTADQKARILKAMEKYMEPDRYSRSTIRNIYFDTDDFILARHSIAKPDFKEKLRIRSYSKADADSTVFVELKRKYDGVVYKRRLGLPEADAMKWMESAKHDAEAISKAEAASLQVANEIGYFASMYGRLRPVLYLSYDREAYCMKSGATLYDGGPGFRVTFDSNIRCRESDLSLQSDSHGKTILEEGKYLMELKCPGAIPMWMTKVLSEGQIYKTSFSKYGTAYCSFMSKTPEERSRSIAAEGYGKYAAAASERRTERRITAGRKTKTQTAGRFSFFSRASA